MKSYLSWFVLFLARIVAADELPSSDNPNELPLNYIPDCKFVVESAGLKMTVDLEVYAALNTREERDAYLAATPVSGLYTYLQPFTFSNGMPDIVRSKKVAVSGKKNYSYDASAYDSTILIKNTDWLGTRGLRFEVTGRKTVVVVQSETHFCLKHDDDTPKHWTIYNLTTKKILGWSMVVNDITGVECNPDVGQVRYVPPIGSEVETSPYALPMVKEFKMAYECVTYLKELERSTGIASKATAATIEVGILQTTCKFWHQSHDDMEYQTDDAIVGVCFLAEIEPVRSRPNFQAILTEAFTNCIMVHYGDGMGIHDQTGAYVIDMTSSPNIVMKQRSIVLNSHGLYTFGDPAGNIIREIGNEAVYSPDKGRIEFSNLSQFIEVDDFPCNPGITNLGPFPVLRTDLSSTIREVVFHVISGPEDIECILRGDYGNDMNCKTGVTHYCSFGPPRIHMLQTCIG